MAIDTLAAPLDPGRPTTALTDLRHWLRAHRNALAMAGLLAVAQPLTSLASSLGLLPEVTPAVALAALSRSLTMAIANFSAFVVAGRCYARLDPRGWRAPVLAFALGACAAALPGSIAYLSGWADMLAATAPGRAFALDTYSTTLSMALIYFAHLQHSRVHEQAARRLAAAKQAQRDARRRLAQSNLQAVQARIDPQLLFDMLDAVRRAYEAQPERAEPLLDQLVAFLRAALPRLQHASSSVPREVELARALARLHELAGRSAVRVALDVQAEVLDARFPPGVLLPLLDDALQQGRAGICALSVRRQGLDCVLLLALPARPSQACLERVRGLLDDLYGPAAALSVDHAGGAARIKVRVPHEHA